MRLWGVLGAACSLLCAVGTSTAVAAPTATPVAGISAPGDGIARGTDDAMWIAQPSNPGRISRVPTAGAPTEFRGGSTANLPSNSAPTGMAVTPDGSAWFLMTGGANEVGRITAGGIVTRYNLTSGRPTSLTTGPDGRLWMTALGANGGDPDLVVGYDLAAARVDVSVSLNPSTSPRSITAGPDGALWFVEGNAPGRLGRVTTSGALTWQSVGGAPTALGAGPSTALWFSRGSRARLAHGRTDEPLRHRQHPDGDRRRPRRRRVGRGQPAPRSAWRPTGRSPRSPPASTPPPTVSAWPPGPTAGCG